VRQSSGFSMTELWYTVEMSGSGWTWHNQGAWLDVESWLRGPTGIWNLTSVGFACDDTWSTFTQENQDLAARFEAFVTNWHYGI
jgi:hypothetical protein